MNETYDFLKDALPASLVEKMQAAAKARSVKCPTCGAGAGKNCRMDVRSDVHAERIEATK